jgi:hypothetical protein
MLLNGRRFAQGLQLLDIACHMHGRTSSMRMMPLHSHQRRNAPAACP